MPSPQETVQPYEPVPEVLTSLTRQDVDDFVRLMPQLSSTERTEADIARNLHGVLSSPTSRTFVVRDKEGRIQAAATGNLCPIPTGNKPWIDDVVTDEGSRGNGYAATLLEAVEGWFLENDVTSSNLTSRPARQGDGGNLYTETGYKVRPTAVYRKQLGAAALNS